MKADENLRVNREYYDAKYVQLDLEKHIERFQHWKDLLETQRNRILTTDAFYSGDFSERLKKNEILEIGAGNGLNTCFMSFLGAKVCAQDISAKSIAKITELSKKLNLNIETYCGDLRSLPIEDRFFNMVVGKSILHHLTHELEDEYMKTIARLLKEDGLVRFVEPCHNLPFLRSIRLLFPKGDRPSILSRKRYRVYKQLDPHPIRSNSSSHFRTLGSKYFNYIEIESFGVEKALIPRKFQVKLLINLLSVIPDHVKLKLSKVQIITFRDPK